MTQTNFNPKRNHRLLYISHYLVDRPGQIIKYSYFMDYLNAAKSSISEDINFIKEVMEVNGLGEIKTIAGSAGGVVYYPVVYKEEQQKILSSLIEKLSQGKRILQGNYIYMSDILQDSFMLSQIGRLIASKYIHHELDAIMTVETKGVGLAAIVARYLNLPFVIARRDSTDTVGSTISVNYLSGSYQKVGKMELAKNSLQEKSRVLIIDDFLRNGGTIQGMIALLEEFNSEAIGICVIGENRTPNAHSIAKYDSLVNVQLVYDDESNQYELDIQAGNLFDDI